MTFKPDYLFEGEPALGKTIEIVPGVHWLRMPLPFKLDHINLWLLQDGDGWTIVDTGICRDEVKAAWQTLFETMMVNKPVKKVVVTHYHPDHMGLAGWLVDRFKCDFFVPLGEWTFGRMQWMDVADSTLDAYRGFYRSAGFTDDMMGSIGRRLGGYQKNVAPIPPSMNRLTDGRTIEIDGAAWEMIVGRGHSPEHACLYCPSKNLLISGDQVLPKISPNVSVWPQEPNGRPLALFLDSLTRIGERIAGDPKVLPSHNWPFMGLHARLDDLAKHHVDRLDEVEEALSEPLDGVSLSHRLFRRELDEHQMFFAIGETLAHVYHLIDQGRIVETTSNDGLAIFARAA